MNSNDIINLIAILDTSKIDIFNEVIYAIYHGKIYTKIINDLRNNNLVYITKKNLIRLEGFDSSLLIDSRAQFLIYFEDGEIKYALVIDEDKSLEKNEIVLPELDFDLLCVYTKEGKIDIPDHGKEIFSSLSPALFDMHQDITNNTVKIHRFDNTDSIYFKGINLYESDLTFIIFKNNHQVSYNIFIRGDRPTNEELIINSIKLIPAFIEVVNKKEDV